MYKHNVLYKVLLAPLGLAASLAWAGPDISPLRVEVMVKNAIQNYQGQGDLPSSDELSKRALRELRATEVLSQQARRNKLDQDPRVRAGWENVQAQYYARAYIDSLTDKVSVSEKDLQALYHDMVQQAQVSLAAFDSKGAAEAALARLRKGLGFDVLLKEIKQQAQKQWVSLSQLPPAIARRVELLPQGQIDRQLVEFDNKFYIVKSERKRENKKDVGEFSAIKDQLIANAKHIKVRQQVDDLLRQYHVQ